MIELHAAEGSALHVPMDMSVNKPLPYLIGLAILATAGFAFGIMGWHASVKAERETRMLEYYLLELDAKFISSGLKKPEDSIAEKLKERK